MFLHFFDSKESIGADLVLKLETEKENHGCIEFALRVDNIEVYSLMEVSVEPFILI